MKQASDRDLRVGSPGLAKHAFAAGPVDEVHLLVVPVVVGGGKPGLPRDVRLELELVDERRLDTGVVHLHHRIRWVTRSGRWLSCRRTRSCRRT
ncbi:MAG TPA: dihydrofolate reductase family protein [Acidimicrobiales bacterium]|nr:dihydrofolate reductase family protein [Acidimicrobiales bacterium]